ncbi:MAG TPA: orotate phosphoribosyltransferase [Candidatus Omnitrophota bacterium]|nr:orotate phosphoribosyltransferase [Candidatus Omnitrophota bacterium]HPS21039.1 orotate phosphoribosyltransferase [Candidatus Omnitrophota bacterium]
MQEREILDIFIKTGAYKQGHFKLSSGLHSGSYLQCALVLENPVIAERLCVALAQKFKAQEPDVVIGPAMGGIVLAYELARALGARALFTERDDTGKMTLRRGFYISPNNKVLIAEDVLTTGKSVNEVIELLRRDSITPIGVTSLVNRSGGKVNFGGIKCESLLNLSIPTFDPNDCPLCKEGLAIEKPGSRK